MDKKPTQLRPFAGEFVDAAHQLHAAYENVRQEMSNNISAIVGNITADDALVELVGSLVEKQQLDETLLHHLCLFAYNVRTVCNTLCNNAKQCVISFKSQVARDYEVEIEEINDLTTRYSDVELGESEMEIAKKSIQEDGEAMYARIQYIEIKKNEFGNKFVSCVGDFSFTAQANLYRMSEDLKVFLMSELTNAED